jgi:hypothetical protein
VRSRKFRIALLAFQLLWYGVIVPGHRRGVVTLDGKRQTPSCCCCCDSQPVKGADSRQPPVQPGHCAICDFTAHLTLPPVVDFELAPHGMLERCAVPVVEQRLSRDIPATYDGRGPPLAA